MKDALRIATLIGCLAFVGATAALAQDAGNGGQGAAGNSSVTGSGGHPTGSGDNNSSGSGGTNGH